MSTYAERLALAMSMRGMNPHTDQSDLARRVGMGCKPQNIQHLLDQNKNAKSSKYTLRIAEVLDVDPQWLSYDSGSRPVDAVLIDSAGNQTILQVKQREVSGDEHPLGSLELAQLRHAEEILHKLRGAELTKALAFLQDLESRWQVEQSPAAQGTRVIDGGQPDPIEAPAKRRAHR